ncbi:hypothetical protein F1880_008582 [Penicillium rolfsii]|nr:hypothetical protein F1880_008582 [Penicillium rolfsii]
MPIPYPPALRTDIPAVTDALHRSRLLNVEEKPFKRISKRLLNPDSLVVSNASLPLTPPPNESDADATAGPDAKRQKRLEDWRTFREDVTLDFSAFEGSIARIQFLLNSNEAERQRYATEKLAILDTMQSVRRNTTELRRQLDEAQRLLALRKTYDDLADKITSNRLLKPREDQQANLQKLQMEITELEKESRDYATTWADRREQFGRIVEEGMQLRRLIRDEKEEVERREGMQEGEEGDEGDATSKGKPSAANSPLPEGESMTPSQQSQDEGSRLQAEKPSGMTGAASPLRQAISAEGEKGSTDQEDANMADEGEITADDAGEQSDELEEGEEPDERMDTS